MLKKLADISIALVSIGLLSGCNKDETSNNSFVPIQVGSNHDANSANNASSNSGGGNNLALNNPPSTASTSGDGNTPAASKIKNLDRVYQTDNLDSTTIKTRGGDLKLWIMDTEPKRAEGMMMLHDNEVKENEGMIFLFPKIQEMKGKYFFWMHNTVLPLDIDYVSKDKKVLNIGKGVPFSEEPVKCAGDYFYVIEVKQGKSAKFGLTPGAKVDIPDSLKGLP